MHGGAHISVIDRRHILVNFNTKADFMKVYTKERWIMKGQSIKVFRWSLWFHLGMESEVALVWISLPALSQYYFKPGFIKSVAKAFGPLLMVASSTSSKSTVVCARFCVELNLTKEYPTKIYVGMESKGDFLPVEMENRSDFCSECHKWGHLRSDCWRNPESKKASQKQDDGGPVRRRQVMPTRKGSRMNGNALRKVWKPIGKIFTLPEVLSVSEKEDVVVAQVFKRLRENLVTPEKEDFMWDEDPEVRDMLGRVFAEDDGASMDIDRLEVISDVRVMEGGHEKNARGGVTLDTSVGKATDVREVCPDGRVSDVNEESAAGVVSVGVVHKDGGIGDGSVDGVVPHAGSGNEEHKGVGDDLGKENFRSSSVGRPHKRGRPRKIKVVLKTWGYCSDIGDDIHCASKGGISGPMTRRKARSSASRNPFNVLSNEDSCLEC